MRGFFIGLTVVLVIAGLFVPVLWVIAIVTALLAIGSAPSGTRPDGKPRSGGLLGGMWDAAAVNMTMRDCPYCRTKISRQAVVCPQCRRDVAHVDDETVRRMAEEAQPTPQIVSPLGENMRWCPCGKVQMHRRAPVCPQCYEDVPVE